MVAKGIRYANGSWENENFPLDPVPEEEKNK